MSNRQKSHRHFTNRQKSDRHFTNWQMSDRHLSNRHLSDRQMSDQQMSDRQMSSTSWHNMWCKNYDVFDVLHTVLNRSTDPEPSGTGSDRFCAYGSLQLVAMENRSFGAGTVWNRIRIRSGRSPHGGIRDPYQIPQAHQPGPPTSGRP